MSVSPLPENEKERLEALLSYQILDSACEQDFDDIVHLASHLCGTSISLVSFVDEHRQWFKAKVGLNLSETPRSESFCAHAIHSDEVMIVPDARKDERFFNNQLVTGEPNVGFYAGMPLLTDHGFKLGTLCVMDQDAQALSEQQFNSLRILAKQVVNLLELRIKTISMNAQAKILLEVNEGLERAEAQATLGSWYLDSVTGNGYWSKQMFRMFGFEPAGSVPEFDEYLERIHPEDRDIVTSAALKMKQGIEPEIRVFRSNPEVLPLRYFLPSTRRAKDSTGTGVRFEGTVLDITEQKIAEKKLAESENRLHTIIQTEPECIKLLGANCELLEMNPAGLAMIEAQDLEQVMGHSVLSLVNPEYREAFIALSRDVFDGKSGVLEFEITGLKGSIRWIETHAVPLRNGEGKIVSLLAVARDCTERKKNEESLRAAEERYRGLFENALDGIFQTTPDGKFITANSATARILGYSSVKELKTTVTDIAAQLYIDPAKRLHIRNMLEKEGQAIGLELMVHKKDKSDVIWLRSNIRAVYDINGGIKHLEGTIKDITKQKRAEDQIRREKELAESFINSLPGVFYLYDDTGKFLRWNANFETVTGYSAEEIDKMHPSEFFEDGPERDLLIKRINEVFVKGHSDLEANFLRKDKRKIPYYFNGRRIEYENRVCLLGVGIDISDRKEAEQQLRISENRMKAFFRSTSSASVLLGEHFEVLAFNPVANQIAATTWGHPLAEGDLFTTLDFGEVTPEIARFLTRALQGQTNRGEFLFSNSKTGDSLWWQAVFMPAYDEEGKIFGIAANFTNIDEIKQAEIKLKIQFEELQKTNQELDHFVYSVSHDLRAPLATILGLINIAEMDTPSPVFKNYLGMIQNNINRLDGFIKDILDYSQNSRKEINIQQIDFTRQVSLSLSDLKMVPGAERLQVILDINEVEPFHSDLTRISILLNNLLSNAIKYQDYSKSSSFVKIQIHTSARRAIMRCSDNGIGINEKHLDKVFNMFYRASETSVGAGLGLYIVKEAVAKLGASITVESKLGDFTSFEIDIPNQRE